MTYTWQLGHTLDQSEKEIVQACMVAVHNDMKACASALGVSYRTIDNKLKLYREQEKEHEETQRAARQKRIDWINEARKMPPQFGHAESVPDVPMPQAAAVAVSQNDMPLPQRRDEVASNKAKR